MRRPLDVDLLPPQAPPSTVGCGTSPRQVPAARPGSTGHAAGSPRHVGPAPAARTRRAATAPHSPGAGPGPGASLHLVDPRRFGFVHWLEPGEEDSDPSLATLGMEALEEADESRPAAVAPRSRRPRQIAAPRPAPGGGGRQHLRRGGSVACRHPPGPSGSSHLCGATSATRRRPPGCSQRSHRARRHNDPGLRDSGG